MNGLLKLVVMICFFLSMSVMSFAEGLNIEQLTYEELAVLREKIDTRIEELKRQYAMENGNRVITLDYEELMLFEKQRKQIIATVERVVDDAPENTKVKWSSSDMGVATVSEDGRVTGVAHGDAVITCVAADDEYIFASLPVHVGKRVTDVTIEPREGFTLRLCDNDELAARKQLEVLITPNNAYCQTVRWTSSDESIVVVDETGMAQALKAGTASITAISNEVVSGDQTQKKSVRKVTVVQGVTEVLIDQEEIRVKKGGTAKLSAQVLPEDATMKNVKWVSSDESIVKVSNGQLTGVSCGLCKVYAYAADGGDVYGSCKVTVYQPVNSLKIIGDSFKVFKGGPTKELKVEVLPNDASYKGVVWTTSDLSIASVNSQGVVSARKAGTCEIICTAADGSGTQTSVTVKVPPLGGFKKEYSITSKGGISIPVLYYNPGATLELSVSNSNIVTADFEEKSGKLYIKVIPERVGTTTITVTDQECKDQPVKFSVTVESSATYNSTSYPKASYEDILRYPDKHRGEQVQIYGKVLQKMTSGSSVILRVGTTNRYYDSVFYVTYLSTAIDASVIEDDFVTIYGKCTGTKTYETVMGSSVTIPSMTAEKISIGRKSN